MRVRSPSPTRTSMPKASAVATGDVELDEHLVGVAELDHRLGLRPHSEPRPTTLPEPRSDSTSRAGVWTRRGPSGKSRSVSSRTTVSCPLNGEVGIASRYRQLSAQAIISLRPSSAGIALPGQPGVEVASPALPQHGRGVVVVGEGPPVEVADEVLHAGTARRRPVADADTTAPTEQRRLPATGSRKRSGHSHNPAWAPSSAPQLLT